MKLLLLGLSAIFAAPAASAAILITFQPSGGNMVMTATGTYNFTGVSSAPDLGIGLVAVFRADSLIVGRETATNLRFSGTWTGTISGNSDLGTAQSATASIPFYVNGEGSFFLKDNQPLSGTVNNTATFSNTSLQTFGLTGGQTATLNLGGGNSVTISIIPEPTAGLLGLVGSLAFFRRRR